MKIQLNKEEINALLQASMCGVLDTKFIPRIEKAIRGVNPFEELMKSLPEIEDDKK